MLDSNHNCHVFLRFSSSPHETSSCYICLSSQPTLTCRCLYGQSCWPKEYEFRYTGDAIIPTTFPLHLHAICLQHLLETARASLQAIQMAFRSARINANTIFEAFIFPGDTISACFLNTTWGFLSCGQGSVPQVDFDARSADDIQAAIKFAKQHNFKLGIMNTGHDYLGRSTARSGFLIWTHYMKDIIRVLFT